MLEVNERGTISVTMVYKRGWTSGQRLPVQTFVEYIAPPPPTSPSTTIAGVTKISCVFLRTGFWLVCRLSFERLHESNFMPIICDETSSHKYFVLFLEVVYINLFGSVHKKFGFECLEIFCSETKLQYLQEFPKKLDMD